jgi:predicted transposase/invertase (TIGR01784 family)
MLPLENPIVNIEYNTTELVPELTEVLRNTIVDVRCTDAVGRQFIVEMQMYWSESFKSRVLLNASKAYVLQLEKAEDFKLLQPVYALNFVNDTFEKSPEMENEYYHYYKIVNVKNTEKQIEGLEFLFVELPKFKPQNKAEQKLHELWLRFLTEINEKTEEVPEDLLAIKEIREAVGYVERGAYSKAQLATYDKWKIAVMTERSTLKDAIIEGRMEGKAEGIIQGRKEGEAKGIIQGKIETAKKMLKKGMSIEDISDCTGLPKQQIEQL